MIAVNCSGVLPTVSTPALKNLSLISALVKARAISWFNRLITGRGGLPTAKSPVHSTISYPGTAVATVGNPGSSGDGLALVTASAFNLPDLVNGASAAAVEHMTCTSFAIKPVSAGPMPLYGT